MPYASTATKHITIVLGKPIAATSVISKVVERLHHSWPTIAIYRPVEGTPPPIWLQDSNLIMQRGLGPAALRELSALEASGIRCVNGTAATVLCDDRAKLLEILNAAGITVPQSQGASTWNEASTMAGGKPVAIKALQAAIGRGAQVLLAPTGVLPPEQPFAGPYVVQQYLPGNPTVQKIYVAGKRTRGLLKASPLVASRTAIEAVQPFEVDRETSKLSTQIADALGLEIFGFDLLYGPDGATVVDVNPFPGFRGIPTRASTSPTISWAFLYDVLGLPDIPTRDLSADNKQREPPHRDRSGRSRYNRNADSSRGIGVIRGVKGEPARRIRFGIHPGRMRLVAGEGFEPPTFGL